MAYNETEQNRIESMEQLSKLAIQGLTMGMAYIGLRPLLNGEPSTAHAGVAGHIADTMFPIVDFLDWPLAAAVVCGGALAWYATKRIPKSVGLPKIVPYSWKVPIGQTYRGKWILHDFGGIIPHSIFCGSTGFGKTAFIELCLYVLCHQQKPEDLQIIIIDLKAGASFIQWEHLPHVISPVRTTVAEAREVLEMAREEMFGRLDEIREAKLRFREPPKRPHLYIVIDEGSLLKLDDTAMECLQHIAAIGREPHVHLLYGTQRPSHDILPVTTRDNMEGRFAFHLNEMGSSSVVLGEKNTAAYDLPRMPGRMIYRGSGGDITLQAAYVSHDMIEAWLKDHAGFVDIEDGVGDEVPKDNANKVSNVGVNVDTSSDIDIARFLG